MGISTEIIDAVWKAARNKSTAQSSTINMGTEADPNIVTTFRFGSSSRNQDKFGLDDLWPDDCTIGAMKAPKILIAMPYMIGDGVAPHWGPVVCAEGPTYKIHMLYNIKILYILQYSSI